jgi:hypothetical protein
MLIMAANSTTKLLWSMLQGMLLVYLDSQEEDLIKWLAKESKGEYVDADGNIHVPASRIEDFLKDEFAAIKDAITKGTPS